MDERSGLTEYRDFLRENLKDDADCRASIREVLLEYTQLRQPFLDHGEFAEARRAVLVDVQKETGIKFGSMDNRTISRFGETVVRSGRGSRHETRMWAIAYALHFLRGGRPFAEKFEKLVTQDELTFRGEFGRSPTRRSGSKLKDTHNNSSLQPTESPNNSLSVNQTNRSLVSDDDEEQMHEKNFRSTQRELSFHEQQQIRDQLEGRYRLELIATWLEIPKAYDLSETELIEAINSVAASFRQMKANLHAMSESYEEDPNAEYVLPIHGRVPAGVPIAAIQKIEFQVDLAQCRVVSVPELALEAWERGDYKAAGFLFRASASYFRNFVRDSGWVDSAS